MNEHQCGEGAPSNSQEIPFSLKQKPDPLTWLKNKNRNTSHLPCVSPFHDTSESVSFHQWTGPAPSTTTPTLQQDTAHTWSSFPGTDRTTFAVCLKHHGDHLEFSQCRCWSYCRRIGGNRNDRNMRPDWFTMHADLIQCWPEAFFLEPASPCYRIR